MEGLRRKNFSTFDKELLTKLITKYGEVLTNKRYDATSCVNKHNAWKKVEEEFNSCPKISSQANVKQMKKLWHAMNSKAINAKTRKKQRINSRDTPSIPDADIDNEVVLDTQCNVMPTLIIEDNGKVAGGGEDYDVFWLHNEIKDVDSENHSTSSLTVENIKEAAADVKVTSQLQKIAPLTKRRAAITLDPLLEEKNIYSTELKHKEKMFLLEFKHKERILELEYETKKTICSLQIEEQILKNKILKKRLETD